MELLSPWETHIAKINLSSKCNLDKITEEMFLMERESPDKVDLCITDESLVPNIISLRDKLITPLVSDYVKNEFHYDLYKHGINLRTWGVILSDKTSLDVHYHPQSNVTSVFYPNSNLTSLMLMDPRGNACRGYPLEIQKQCFGNLRIKPNAGDLYIYFLVIFYIM